MQKETIRTVLIWYLLSVSLPALFGSAWGAQGRDADTFEERVQYTALSPSHTMVSFTFHQSTPLTQEPTTFPWAARRLASSSPFDTLHLTLTRGRWDYFHWNVPTSLDIHVAATGADYLHWGVPTSHDIHVAATGAEVAVQWPSPSQHTQHWSPLQHRLSGLMCASLSLLSDPHRAAPHPTYHAARATHPDTASSSDDTNTHSWYAGSLPQESVCTENLTPWLHMLPCGGRAGLAALLGNRSTVFSSDYHSLSLTLRVESPSPTPTTSHKHNTTSGPDTAAPLLHLTQTLTLVLPTHTDLTHAHTDRESAVSEVAAVLLGVGGGGNGLGAAQIPPCPAATHSSVMHTQSRQEAVPSPPASAALLDSVLVAKGLHLGHIHYTLDIGVVKGIGQLHTHSMSWLKAVIHSDVGLTVRVQPGWDRGPPTLTHVCMDRLPRQPTQVVLRVAISRAFLTLDEHRPDAHRGWDIPPARLLYMTTTGQDTRQSTSTTPYQLVEVLGPTLLLPLPTADVAMPYNVICLTSTVMAVFLGAILNTLLRRNPSTAKSQSGRHTAVRTRADTG